jgi:ketosteroid isomerase-like protein
MTASDSTGVEAASQAFYTALSVLDDGTCMAAVWANTPYVTYVGPSSVSIVVGWDAQKRYWASFNAEFAWRCVGIADVHIHTVGDLAWQIGREVGQARMSDGTERNIDWIVTNVFERIGGQWLMVSHHAQTRPGAGP